MPGLPQKMDMSGRVRNVRLVPTSEHRPCYSITSSARARSAAGSSRPRAFAALTLISNSYLVGACTGRCQFRTHAPQQIRPIRHLVAAAEHRMRYPRIDPHRGFESRRHACRRLVERRFLGGEAEPSRVASPLLTVIARRTVTCCQTTNAGSC